MKHFINLTLPIALMVFTAMAYGQEEPQAEPAEQNQTHDLDIIGGEGGAIVIEAVQSDDDGFSSSSMKVMAIDASDMDHPMFISDGGLPFAMGEGDEFSMLNNPSVQKDLELVDDQLQRVKDINQDFSEQMKDVMKGMHGEDGSFSVDRAKELGQLIRDLKAQQKEQISDILLPQQQERLQQVALQMQMKRRGTAGLLAGKLADELGITSEQTKRIKARQKQLQKELEDQIAELRENARKSLLDELTKDQRRKLDELIGQKFETKEEDFQSKRYFRAGNRKDF